MTTILIIDDHRNQKNPGEEGEIEEKNIITIRNRRNIR
jgi:hypothetical protein